MACCEKTCCKSCKEISKLAYLATHLHVTYTFKPTDKQIVKQRLHFLHEIRNFYSKTKRVSPIHAAVFVKQRSRICEPTNAAALAYKYGCIIFYGSTQ